MSGVTVKDIQERFDFEVLAGSRGIEREVELSDLSRPGLEMAGYFDFYPRTRIQLLGKTEISFFEMLPEAHRIERMDRLCTPDTPAFVLAHGVPLPPELESSAERMGITVLGADVPTTRLSGMLTNYLGGRLAPMETIHGVLVDIYGVGVMITGSSGVGKSETALELVKRGHRLIADDSVEIREVAKNILIGSPPPLLRHMLEIRGVGIIDIMTLFGASAVKDDKRVVLVIELELWDQEKMYDRLGVDKDQMKIMDSEVTKLVVPVRPGRNLSVIIEVAAMDYRLKTLGINAAEDFTNKLDAVISEKAAASKEKGINR